MLVLSKRLMSVIGFCCLFVLSAAAQAQNGSCPLKFHITLSKEVAAQTLRGRMLVFMSDSTQPKEMLDAGFIPGETWIAGVNVEGLTPGGSIDFDPNVSAYPHPFSQAKPGTYQFMALLDTDHGYPYYGPDNNSYYSAVVKVENVNPLSAAPVELTIDKRFTGRSQPADAENVKYARFESPLLTRFWGRPIYVEAGVVLPPSYGKDKARRYPAVYSIHGFGGDHTGAWRQGPQIVEQMRSGKIPEMIWVFLNGHLPTGHHEFADSVNNGPWGEALTREFIPHLEKTYRMVGRPYARFVTGHSSGGWSSLWLQVTYPDFFGGTWSTSPDPVDLRNFTGIDATPGSTDNAYTTKDGKPKNLIRDHDKDLATTEEFARQEIVLGDYGGQFASFEWVWSPKGPGGRPLEMFNRETGELNQDVLKAWQKYDIRKILDDHWATLGPKLKGKLHLFCGTADTFHLNEPFQYLCDFLKSKHSDANCELVPDRTHFDLYRPYKTYPDGLFFRIANEMGAKYKSASAAKAKAKTAAPAQKSN